MLSNKLSISILVIAVAMSTLSTLWVSGVVGGPDKQKICSEQTSKALVEISLFRQELQTLVSKESIKDLSGGISSSSRRFSRYGSAVNYGSPVYAGEQILASVRDGRHIVKCDSFYGRIAKDELAYVEGVIDSARVAAKDDSDTALKLLKFAIADRGALFSDLSDVAYSLISSDFFDADMLNQRLNQFTGLREDSKEWLLVLVEERRQLEEKYNSG